MEFSIGRWRVRQSGGESGRPVVSLEMEFFEVLFNEDSMKTVEYEINSRIWSHCRS